MIAWRKSTYSGTQDESDCIEVASLPGRSKRVIGIRDSKNPDGPMLIFNRAGFRALLDQVRADVANHQ